MGCWAWGEGRRRHWAERTRAAGAREGPVQRVVVVRALVRVRRRARWRTAPVSWSLEWPGVEEATRVAGRPQQGRSAMRRGGEGSRGRVSSVGRRRSSVGSVGRRLHWSSVVVRHAQIGSIDVRPNHRPRDSRPERSPPANVGDPPLAAVRAACCLTSRNAGGRRGGWSDRPLYPDKGVPFRLSHLSDLLFTRGAYSRGAL